MRNAVHRPPCCPPLSTQDWPHRGLPVPVALTTMQYINAFRPALCLQENQNEVATIASVSPDGRTLRLAAPLQYQHYGCGVVDSGVWGGGGGRQAGERGSRAPRQADRLEVRGEPRSCAHTSGRAPLAPLPRPDAPPASLAATRRLAPLHFSRRHFPLAPLQRPGVPGGSGPALALHPGAGARWCGEGAALSRLVQ